MSTEKNIATLKFNQLSQAKYDTITPVEGEFYITGDEDLVHKTGNETIDGTKSFNKNIYVLDGGSLINVSNITSGTAVSSSQYPKHSVIMDNSKTNILAMMQYNAYASVGTVSINAKEYLDVSKSINLNLYPALGKIELNNNNNSNQSHTLATNATNSVLIPTMGWVNNPATSTNVVHRSGNETIAGTKTFSTTPVVGTLAASNNSTSAASTAWVNSWKNANTSNAIVVVESYISGSEWYRVWSDGWVEQGGIYNVNNDNYQTFTVQLIKPMLNVYYNISIQPVRSANGNAYIPMIYNKTSSSFSVGNCVCNNPGASWYVCGEGE